MPGNCLNAAPTGLQQAIMKISFRKLGYLRMRLEARLSGRACLHFLHISKTGGTAFKHALKDHVLAPQWRMFLQPHRITLADVPRGHKLLFVTSDPVTRFVSSFHSRLRQGLPSRLAPWREGEELAFQRFPDPNSLALDPGHPQHAEALEAMRRIRHINSYWDWFGDEQLLRKRWQDIIFIGRIESFADDFEALKKLLALPQDLMLPGDEKRANRSEARQPLEPAAEQLVRQWYRRDYEFLDLCAKWRDEHHGAVAESFC